MLFLHIKQYCNQVKCCSFPKKKKSPKSHSSRPMASMSHYMGSEAWMSLTHCSPEPACPLFMTFTLARQHIVFKLKYRMVLKLDYGLKLYADCHR